MHSSESWFSEGVRVYQLGSACPTTNNKVGAVLRAASVPNRQRTLRVYCRKHDGLMEAGNRLAGIGQELRNRERPPPGRRRKICR